MTAATSTPAALRRRTDTARAVLAEALHYAAVLRQARQNEAHRERAARAIAAFPKAADAAAAKGLSSVRVLEVRRDEYRGDIAYRAYNEANSFGRPEWLLGGAALVYAELVRQGYTPVVRHALHSRICPRGNGVSGTFHLFIEAHW